MSQILPIHIIAQKSLVELFVLFTPKPLTSLFSTIKMNILIIIIKNDYLLWVSMDLKK